MTGRPLPFLTQPAKSNKISASAEIFGMSFFGYAACGIIQVIPHPVLCRMACDLAQFSRGEPLLDAA